MSLLGEEDILVYTPGRTRSNVLPWNGSPNEPGQDAICGRTAWPQLWHGTGDQEEYERARDQPLCSGCEVVLRHRMGRVGSGGGADPSSGGGEGDGRLERARQ